MSTLPHAPTDKPTTHPQCEGGELFERIAARGSLTEREAAHFFRQMVEVVRHAHALGIMHRGTGRGVGCGGLRCGRMRRSLGLLRAAALCKSPHAALADIKPENFMLADSTDDARIKACDFGA